MFLASTGSSAVPVISDWRGFSFTRARRTFSFSSGVEYLKEKSRYDETETETK